MASDNVVFNSTGTQTCEDTLANCEYLDITSTDHLQVHRFQIRTTLEQNVSPLVSSWITIRVTCGKGSTLVYSSVTNLTVNYEQYNTTDRYYWFQPFTCQYPDCCTSMSYEVLNTNTPSDPPTAGEIWPMEFT